MQKIEIKGEYRKEAGKGIARRLRMNKKIPAVIYSKGTSTLLTVDPKEVIKILHSTAGENALITLKILEEREKEVGTHVAILRDFQVDPINGAILHADFFEISLSEPIVVKVIVEITGSIPVGVKNDSGAIRHDLRELEIRCLPSLIPDHIQVDASNLGVGEAIHVKDVLLAEGIEMMTDPTLPVVSVTATISEEKLESLIASPTDAGMEEADAEAAAETQDEKK
ncbi:MAG: 50S ribosomal protein L25 [Nitrospiria bacterium]